MFLKNFRTKSNVQLKSSDRKKLQSRIASKFACNEADLHEMFPSKASVSFLKIIAHSGEMCGVYTVDKLPMFFELPNAVLLPTVYALWQLPSLVPAFTTHPEVLPRLAKGANLMLPGRLCIFIISNNRKYLFMFIIKVLFVKEKVAMRMGTIDVTR